MPVIFVKKQPEWDIFTKSPNGDVGKYMRKQGDRIQNIARRQVGHDTGALAASIQPVVTSDSQGVILTVGSPLSYALAVHEGTPPREIRPKRGRVLRFAAHGKIVYAQKVFYPGTPPNRYLYDAMRRVVLSG